MIHTKGTKFCKVLQLYNWKLPPMAHYSIIFALFWKTYDLLTSFLKCGSRVAHHLFNQTMVQSFQGGARISEKDGPRRLPPYPSLISILERAVCLVGKAYVSKMKLNLNFFPLGIQIPKIRYCIFKKSVICTNLITCSTKLSLHAAERGQ